VAMKVEALGSEVSTGFHGVKCLWRSRLSKASFTRMEISQPLTAHRTPPWAHRPPDSQSGVFVPAGCCPPPHHDLERDRISLFLCHAEDGTLT
jgi:hypothetical protein